jgi:hypothetical protein
MFTESPFRKPPQSLNSNLESLDPDPQSVIPIEIEQLDELQLNSTGFLYIARKPQTVGR